MSQLIEWQNFQKAYNSVLINEQTSRTDEVLSWLIGNKKIEQYINTQTVLARQAKVAESIKQGTEIVNKGDWIVLKERQTIKMVGPEFEFLYEHDVPINGSGAVKMYQLKRRNFWGAIFEGAALQISDAKNKNILLEAGDLIGAYEPKITKNNFLVIKKEMHTRYFTLVK